MAVPSQASPELPPLGDVLISSDRLQARVQELGAAISDVYAGKDLILVGVLKGVLCFMADLLRAITIPVEVDFLSISGYGPGERGHGEVRLLKDLERPVEGRHVLFIEDIVDTGLSLAYLLRHIRSREPATLEVCALLDRPRRRIMPLNMCFVGFEIPDVWVVGYGMDYRERYRNLPYIAVLHPPGRPEVSPEQGEVIVPEQCADDSEAENKTPPG
ncbi:MAG: hypoxanthine phosphoribosyltransferase [Anaerolineae bacterium]